MSPIEKIEELLARVKGPWPSVLKLAAWIFGIYGSFMSVPPPNRTGTPEEITGIALIIIGAFVLICIGSTFGFSKYHHKNIWVWSLIITLPITVIGWGVYGWAKAQWICPMGDGKAYIIGSKLRPEIQKNVDYEIAQGLGAPSCEKIIAGTADDDDDPTYAWLPDGIERHRTILTALYLAIIPFAVGLITSGAQLSYCLNQPDMRSFYTGEWRDEEKHTVTLKLNVIGKSVTGRIEFVNQGVSRAPQNLTPENTKFKGVSLSFELPNQESKYIMNISDDGERANLYIEGKERSWTLRKVNNTQPSAVKESEPEITPAGY